MKDDFKIWLPKGICLISVNPYYDFFSQILIDIWFTLFVDKQSQDGSSQRFIVEQLVKQLVDGMPPTTPGIDI